MGNIKFYFKHECNGIVLITPVDSTTIYTHCCKCGNEISTDIEALIYNEEIDLDSTITCENCMRGD